MIFESQPKAKPCTDYTSKQMLRLSIPEGFWAVNVARLGAKPRWRLQHLHKVLCPCCGELNNSTREHTYAGGCWSCGVPHGRKM